MSRSLASLAGAAALTLLLAGCGGAVTAGSAAVLGDTRITTTQVADAVAEVQRARGQQPGQPDPLLTQQTLNRLVLGDLIDQAAAREGVVVTEGEVDAARLEFEANFGGPEAFEQALLDAGIPPSAIEDEIRVSVTATALQTALAPDATADQASSVLLQYIVDLSEELGTTVSPRFGTWLADQLTIGPVPTDLAVGPQAEPLPAEG